MEHFCSRRLTTLYAAQLMKIIVLVLAIVTRLGDFWNFLSTDFITKVAQMFGGFLGICEKHCFSSQTG